VAQHINFTGTATLQRQLQYIKSFNTAGLHVRQATKQILLWYFTAFEKRTISTHQQLLSSYNTAANQSYNSIATKQQRQTAVNTAAQKSHSNNASSTQ
jgi:hypothetical protein